MDSATEVSEVGDRGPEAVTGVHELLLRGVGFCDVLEVCLAGTCYSHPRWRPAGSVIIRIARHQALPTGYVATCASVQVFHGKWADSTHSWICFGMVDNLTHIEVY